MAEITTENYLKDLVKQKQALVDSLNTYGVEASPNEKFNTLVPKVEEVYEAGKANGGGSGYDEVYEAGQKAEYDSFWDNYQNNGNRKDYECAFSGTGWTAETMLPKYDIISPSSAYMMFRTCGYNGDLDDLFKNRGLTLDFSGCKNFQYMFYNCLITAIGQIDCSGATNGNIPSIFNSPNLDTIRNLIPPPVAMANTCWGAGLVNLGIGGEIVDDFNVSRCTKLTHDSLMSIINALKDFVLATMDLGNATSSCYSIYNNTLNEYVYLNEGESLTLNVTHGNNSANGVLFGGNIENNDFVFLEIVGEPAAFLAGLEVKTITIRYGEYIESEEQPLYNATIVYKSAEATQSKTLTIGADNLAKLTDEEKKKATDKGWILA